MAIQKTEAFILKTQPFRSSSLIVTFFTRAFGKIRALVKGVRREGETRGSTFEPFTRLEIIFYEKMRSDLHLVSEASMIESYEGIRSHLESLSYASYFCELVDSLCEVHDAHEKIFELLDFVFHYLPSLGGRKMARIFEIKLLREIGWLPFLSACLQCGTKTFERGYFSVRQGGLFCSECGPKVPGARPITPESLAAMRYYSSHDLADSLKLAVSSKTANELETFLSRFILERHQKPFKSLSFLEKIKPLLPKN